MQCFFNLSNNGFFIKIYICNGCKEVVGNQMVYFFGNRELFFAKLCSNGCQPFCVPYQQILHGSNLRCFSANSYLGTACAAGGFLTLIAKHFRFHFYILL